MSENITLFMDVYNEIIKNKELGNVKKYYKQCFKSFNFQDEIYDFNIVIQRKRYEHSPNDYFRDKEDYLTATIGVSISYYGKCFIVDFLSPFKSYIDGEIMYMNFDKIFDDYKEAINFIESLFKIDEFYKED